MNKTIICNIPMKDNVKPSVYISDDKSLPSSDIPVKYPVNAFLSNTLNTDDNVKVLLLAKKDQYSAWQKNASDFIDELNHFNEEIGASITYTTVDTDFVEKQSVHELLMSKIVDEIDENSPIIADITYGPKDLPIILFTALSFAEKFLSCDIDNIIYGKANFEGDKVVNTQLCDMIPLYCLSSITNTIRCVEPGKAKQMLKSLLSM